MSGSAASNEKVNRSSRACLNCRKHKMKCENNDTPPCKRCEATGKNCIFTLRANAAIGTDHAGWSEQVEMRLYDLEVEVKSWRRYRHLLHRKGPASGHGHKEENENENEDEEDNDIDTGDTEVDGNGNGDLDGEEDDELGILGQGEGGQEVKGRGKKRRLTVGSINNNNNTHKDRPKTNRSGSNNQNNQNQNQNSLPDMQMDPNDQGWMVGMVWEPKEDAQELIKVVARLMEGLGQARHGKSGINKKDTAWSVGTVEGLWNSFEQDFLPFTGTGLQRLQPTQLTPLLIASILMVTSRSLSSPESTVWSQTFEQAFHTAFSELDSNTDFDLGKSTMEADQRGYMDVFGLLIFCQAEIGGKRSLSGHIAWAHQIILDSVGLGETVREEEWRTLWDALHTLDQQHRSLHLRRSIVPATPPAPPFSGHSAVSFPSAAEDMAKINDIGYKHFASRGFSSILDGVWRRRSARGRGEPKQVSIKDLAVLDNWLSQLKKCAQRYDLQDELPYLLDRLVIESIAASRHSVMSGTDHVATSRRVLQCHVARPLTVASSYQLVLLTSAALQVLDDGNDGNRNVVDLQLVLQLMVYLRNLELVHLRGFATELHACLNRELEILGSTNRLNMQGIANDSGMVSAGSVQQPMGFTPMQMGGGALSQNDQEMHSWTPVTNHTPHQQHPDQIFGDFDPSFLSSSSGMLMPQDLPFEMRSTPVMQNQMTPRSHDPGRQPMPLPPQPFQIQDALNKSTETWPPTFLSWLNTSATDPPPDLYGKF